LHYFISIVAAKRCEYCLWHLENGLHKTAKKRTT